MSFIHKKISIIFLLSNFLMFTFCSGQSQRFPEIIVDQFTASAIGNPVKDIGKNIGCIMQDKFNNYWFASNGDGVFRYDGKTLLHITQKDGLISNFVLSIQQDIHGNLWFSTRDGFCRFNGKVFTDYTSTIKNAPYGKLKYSKGGIFFGHLNGVCFYDGISFTNFRISPVTYSPSQRDMNRSYSIYSNIVDKEGNIWFGTESQGVCRYDGKIFSYLTDQNLAAAAVRTIFQDKLGIIYFGNNGGGFFRYDGKTLRNITEEKGLGNPEFLKGHFNNKPGSLARVWTMNEDKEGILWIGTIDAGVFKYDGTNVINYTTLDGLKGDAIWTIFKDNKGELWFVTNGDAICKFDGQAFTKFEFTQ